MKEKGSEGQLQNRQQNEQPYNQGSKEQGNSSAKRMNREAEDELLTTGGPVNRSSIENESDHGVVDANTGGMNMEDEEANTSKDSFPGVNRAYGIREYEPDDSEADYSSDKTEGIVNPRSTISEWANWKTSMKREEDSDSKKGEGNTDRDAEEFNDIAPV